MNPSETQEEYFIKLNDSATLKNQRMSKDNTGILTWLTMIP